MQGRIHQDMLEFSVSVPAGKLAIGLSALAEVLCHPLCSDDDIRAAHRAITATIDRYARWKHWISPRSSPINCCMTATRLPRAGWVPPESLAHITPDDVRAAYRNYVLPNAAVMAIVGRCDVDEARGQAQALFGLWADHPRCQRPDRRRPPRSPTRSWPCANRR